MVLSSQWHRTCTHSSQGLASRLVTLPCALCTLLSGALTPWQFCIFVPGLLGFRLHVSPSAGLWCSQSWVDFCLVTNSTFITPTAFKKNMLHNCFFSLSENSRSRSFLSSQTKLWDGNCVYRVTGLPVYMQHPPPALLGSALWLIYHDSGWYIKELILLKVWDFREWRIIKLNPVDKAGLLCDL